MLPLPVLLVEFELEPCVAPELIEEEEEVVRLPGAPVAPALILEPILLPEDDDEGPVEAPLLRLKPVALPVAVLEEELPCA